MNDVSRCLNCGFEFYEVYRKHGKWREWHEHTGVSERYTNDMEPTEEVSKTIEGSTEHLQPLRKKMNIDNLTILLHLWYILLGIGNLVRPLTSTTLIASYSLLFNYNLPKTLLTLAQVIADCRSIFVVSMGRLVSYFLKLFAFPQFHLSFIYF